MATITEDYVSFEIAKLLKEKGFTCEEIHKYYDISDEQPTLYTDSYIHEFDESFWMKDLIMVPTLQMAIKWLREVYNTIIIIIPSVLQSDNLKWIASIRTFNKEEYYLEEQGIVGKYNTYEEATENAIKCCLENLI